MVWRVVLASSLVALLPVAACGNGDPANLVRQPIGPEGGLISSHDGVLTIVLQPGALDGLYDVEIFPSDEPPVVFGPAYRVRPDLDLRVAAEVTYRRALPSDPEGVAVAAIRRADYEAQMGHWTPLPTLDLNLDADEVIATDSELSLYYALLSGDDMIATSGADGGPGTDPTMGDSGTGDTEGPGPTGGETMGMDTGDTGMAGCGDGSVAAGELCFDATDFAMGAGPTDVAIADIDGNGQLDVVTSNGGADTISIRLGDGRGGLGGMDTLAVGASPQAVVAADLNNANGVDVVVALAGGGVVLAAATGGGALAVQPASPAGTNTVDLGLAFLDPDDQLDVVALDAGGGAVYPFLTTDAGLGSQGMVALDQLAGTAVGLATGSFNDAAGDMDGDAFAFGGGGSQGFDGSGDGGLTPGGIAAAFGTDLGRAVAGDFVGSGALDIAVVDRAGGVFVLTGAGTAMFAVSELIATGSSPVDVAVADVDDDGRDDLLVADATDGTVTVVTQDGGGSFAVAATFDVASTPSGIAAADLNGDGIADIVVAAEGADAVTVLVSNP